MSRVVAFHSFRGGTGKSNTTANVAVMAARRRLRVGVIDTDIQSPGIHILLGIDQSAMTRSLMLSWTQPSTIGMRSSTQSSRFG